ncbi:UNVERIFIED_CONTAM: hypothetical protein Scaly_1711800 [Sesamum calycinum]|uniref:Reverse transcriptase domain-containing protein n=1 Tax=Sesamum calycinum TaxID=2727403 RepID=A0AAW2NVZ0_9LAMI
MDSEHLEDGLTDEDRRSLCVMLTLEEVREAVFSIDLDSVAGPDGFGAIFFHTCWEIISDNVFSAVTEFFRGVEMPKGFTATTISLIPKTSSPTCWSEYRPISLCNSGFVPGRLLSDNVLLAQELVHSLESRRLDANVVFKLDMAKAYNRISWEFLYQVLRQKGFPQRWISLVANAVSHCWFSVLVNGLDRLFAAHPTIFYQAPGRIRVSHLAYANDLMIFTTTCRQNMELLRELLRVSGQLINGSKSSFIVGRQASSLQMQAVQDVLGYQLKHLPVTYLGVPLYKGNRKAYLFDSIISRLRDMLQGWAMTNLSRGGRLALIRSVLQATPLHLLQACFPMAEGGLGVRSLADYVRAFSMKLWWRFWGKSSLWLEYLHGRYCRNLHPTIVPYNRSVSFWHDNWLGEKPLAQLLHRDTYTMEPLNYYWHEGDWNVPQILRTILMPFAQTICQIPIAAGQGDKIVWTGSSTGDFSTNSAWKAIQQVSPRRQLLADVWHRSLGPTISVFLWRLFQDRIPVDARMQ